MSEDEHWFHYNDQEVCADETTFNKLHLPPYPGDGQVLCQSLSINHFTCTLKAGHSGMHVSHYVKRDKDGRLQYVSTKATAVWDDDHQGCPAISPEHHRYCLERLGHSGAHRCIAMKPTDVFWE